ncbi:unnamed protein product, partial [Closterium sp. NIES-53]
VRVTPPDGGLCVGNGFILQTVNVALAVYNTRGCQLTRTIPHNEFFNVLPSVVQRREPYSASMRGDNIGDMSCTYDPAARRFFLSAYWLFAPQFAITTPGPTASHVSSFLSPPLSSCPPLFLALHALSACYGAEDYPQIGTDAHGELCCKAGLIEPTCSVLICSRPPYLLSLPPNSPSLHLPIPLSARSAMGKEQLARTCTASILRVAIPYSPALTSPSYTVYPHKVPADGSYDTANNGTMYFGYMGVNFNGAPDEIVLVPNVTIIGAFALTGTSALGSIEAVDRIVPHIAAVETPPFFLPMSVRQRPGPTPTAWRFNRREAAIDAFAAGMQAVLVQPQRHTMWLAFTSAFGPALGSSSVVLAKIRLRLREEASGEVASGEASGEVASGEVSGEVASGEASGEVASGEASGEVASGEASGEVASGEASGEVASGEALGEVASGEASGEVASGEASGEVASGDALGEVACGEPSSEVVMNGTVGETEAVEAASGGWSFEVQLEGFKAVGVQGNSLLRPAMALNRRGRGILAAALAGPSFYPSAAYALVDSTLRVGPVTVAAPGGAPLDDYSGYLFEERAMRYGDYHTATTDEHGNAWAVVEYVPGVPRTEWTNWATYIFKVQL